MHIRHLPALVTLVYAVWVKTGDRGYRTHTGPGDNKLKTAAEV